MSSIWWVRREGDFELYTKYKSRALAESVIRASKEHSVQGATLLDSVEVPDVGVEVLSYVHRHVGKLDNARVTWSGEQRSLGSFVLLAKGNDGWRYLPWKLDTLGKANAAMKRVKSKYSAVIVANSAGNFEMADIVDKYADVVIQESMTL